MSRTRTGAPISACWGCLAVWFCVSFGAGILLVDVLNRWHIGGAPLGFWIAQQGSIYLFLLLVVCYS